jgi:hypothetical protein
MLIATKRPVDMVIPEHPLKALKQGLLLHQLCRETCASRKPYPGMTCSWTYGNEAADGRVYGPAAACYPVAVH